LHFAGTRVAVTVSLHYFRRVRSKHLLALTQSVFPCATYQLPHDNFSYSIHISIISARVFRMYKPETVFLYQFSYIHSPFIRFSSLEVSDKLTDSNLKLNPQLQRLLLFFFQLPIEFGDSKLWRHRICDIPATLAGFLAVNLSSSKQM
jgi:uncharacterized membrane protein